jgi:hypothetical protein
MTDERVCPFPSVTSKNKLYKLNLKTNTSRFVYVPYKRQVHERIIVGAYTQGAV